MKPKGRDEFFTFSNITLIKAIFSSRFFSKKILSGEKRQKTCYLEFQTRDKNFYDKL